MTALICIDWGSSNLRAALIEDGAVVDSRRSDRGIKRLQGREEMEAVFDEVVGGWADRVQNVYLSGMVTSRNGWVETDYLPVPATLDDLMRGARQIRHGALTLNFLPGISQADPPDVMRGEEVQLARVEGAGLRVVVLPGTHSKWVLLDGDKVTAFRTCITGELLELLGAHSLVGKLAEPGPSLGPAFDRGVAAGHETGAIASVFAARAGVLLGQIRPDEVTAYLGGLLIGIELENMIRLLPGAGGRPIQILADGAVAASYERACDLCGVPRTPTLANSAFDGFSKLLSCKGVPING